MASPLLGEKGRSLRRWPSSPCRGTLRGQARLIPGSNALIAASTPPWPARSSWIRDLRGELAQRDLVALRDGREGVHHTGQGRAKPPDQASLPGQGVSVSPPSPSGMGGQASDSFRSPVKMPLPLTRLVGIFGFGWCTKSGQMMLVSRDGLAPAKRISVLLVAAPPGPLARPP